MNYTISTEDNKSDKEEIITIMSGSSSRQQDLVRTTTRSAVHDVHVPAAAASSSYFFEFGIWFYCSLLAAAVPVMIPALQFGFVFRLWDQYNKPVNRDHCINSCWDTIFKGTQMTR